MEFKHPKYYAELRRLGRVLADSQVTSAQAPRRKPKGTSCPDDKPPNVQARSDKRPSRRLRVQASSQSSQAPGSDDQGTSAQAHGPGCKQRG